MVARLIEHLRSMRRRLARDRRGAVAVTFALAALTVLLAVGSGIDLGRVYLARQQLSAVATLTCQYANRPSIVQMAFGDASTGGGAANYASAVNHYETAAFTSQNVSWSQSTATPFSYAMAGTGTVAVSATIPTSLMYLIGITTMPVSAAVQCFSSPASGSQPVPDSSTTLVMEGFENVANSTTLSWYTPGGKIEGYSASNPNLNPVVNSPPATVGYVGLNGTEWLIMGYCLEIDKVGRNVATVPEGTHEAELDCDNGSGAAGNSSISTRVYLTARAYELRWDFAARVPNTYYQTSYICGTTASDTSWANDTSYTYGGLARGARTNQINAYLDLNTTGAPPVHTTLDGSQTLGGSNMIDECVYSSGWVERSVSITVTTAGYYWLSFAADGANDSYGGQIDDIRLCTGTCAGTVQDNYPPTWVSSGSNYVTLFEDNFESPTYSGSPYNNSGDVGLSTGSSSDWGETGQGWANAPTNQLPYWTAGCPQAIQCVELGWGTNSLIARPFLLVPGYYQISYDFVSEVTFTTATDSYYCGATPAGAGLPTSNSSTGTLRVGGGSMGTLVHDTNAVGVFMSDAQMASTPNPSRTLGSTTTYTNTTLNGDGSIDLNGGTTPMLNADGSVSVNAAGTPVTTTTTPPTVPPNAISLSNYTVSTTSPLLDLCGYANSTQTRTRNVQILKPAFYWLTLAALGTADSFGGQIDDVMITALGSPYMTGTHSSPVTIPVPGPQPGSTLYFTGFSIITGGQY